MENIEQECEVDNCKTYCSCLKQYKKLKKEKNVSNSLKILERKKIKIKNSKQLNIVLIKINNKEYFLTLNSFLLREKGTKNWIKKNKVIYSKNNSLNFGKYKGEKVKDILTKDKKYLDWLLLKTKYFIYY